MCSLPNKKRGVEKLLNRLTSLFAVVMERLFTYGEMFEMTLRRQSYKDVSRLPLFDINV